MKLPNLLFAIAFSAPIAAFAQNAPDTSLEELPAVGMILEASKLCKIKPTAYANVSEFKKLARESYIKVKAGDVKAVDDAFESGAQKVRALKQEITPERCAAIESDLERIDVQFGLTNNALRQILAKDLTAK